MTAAGCTTVRRGRPRSPGAIAHNSATLAGGGCSINPLGALTLANCTVEWITASDGGGILRVNGAVNLTNTTFTNNTPHGCTGVTCP